MTIKIKSFQELTIDELHDLMQLRSEVFVVEQDCVYQDIDGKDRKALHILGFYEGELSAYSRCFQPGDYFEEAAIGRIVVDKRVRDKGLGHQIVDASIEAVQKTYNTSQIKLSAQTYLIDFYTSHGFQTTGEEYLEDGIPHIAMIKK
ncbi:GNAT family N-acetyltransferase [Aureitalea sp. L0-47]|uniref:GNAT family N-acetyltransferase n=1 Tax=Aureitalea sp. L0-47 TaxID=2816962 RepID=UPI002237800F|nr:GNAT family N-acetyltransferase [Aureitalea sp. L0-47]MCW5519917.1 GNAT family N-acetyltransferase [Aureitalea sp. L0-47]